MAPKMVAPQATLVKFTKHRKNLDKLKKTLKVTTHKTFQLESIDKNEYNRDKFSRLSNTDVPDFSFGPRRKSTWL